MDPTLMRDVLVYSAARRLGRYAARSRFVELRLNRRYHGVYVLTERPKLDKRRIDIKRKGITGGYLLEMSGELTRSQPGDALRLPATNRPVLYADPDKGDLNKREERYISGFAGRAELLAEQAPAQLEHPAPGERAIVGALLPKRRSELVHRPLRLRRTGVGRLARHRPPQCRGG
jgi:hypothetical protein